MNALPPPRRARTLGRAGRVAVLACAVIGLAVAIAWGASRPPGPVTEAAKRRPAISITGRVENIYPGIRARIPLTLRNRSRRTLIVKSVRARPGNPPASCPGSNLLTRRKRVGQKVPPRQRRRVDYPVVLSTTAPDACQDARFPLRYRARVVRP